MEINNWQQKHLYVYLFGTFNALIRLRQLGQIWLLNCFEGCQHTLGKKKVKIAQIKTIIITHNNTRNINGLLGLLSTISLNTGNSRIDIYAPKEIHKYIFWGRKYSKTNFRYKLYLHDLSSNIIVQHLSFCFHAFVHIDKDNCSVYSFMDFEHPGVFNCENIKKYNVPLGYLYSYFKAGQNFILPDGQIIYGRSFIYGYYLGAQIVLINRSPVKRELIMTKNSLYAIYC